MKFEIANAPEFIESALMIYISMNSLENTYYTRSDLSFLYLRSFLTIDARSPKRPCSSIVGPDSNSDLCKSSSSSVFIVILLLNLSSSSFIGP